MASKSPGIDHHESCEILKIYDDFVEFRKHDIRKKQSGMILSVKLHLEILNPTDSPYNNDKILPLTQSINNYLKQKNAQQKILELDMLLSGVEETKKAEVFLSALQAHRKTIAVKQEFQIRHDDWDVHIIYDGTLQARPEGRLFLGGFETGADVRFGHGKVCIPENKIDIVITIMQESYLGDEQWQELKSAFQSHGIQNIQIKNIIDYKVDDQDNPDIEITCAKRTELQKLFGLMLTEMVPQIDRAISDGQNVLVHCVEGKSRSASLIAAWLGKKLELTTHEAYQYVKKIRKNIDPNRDYIKEVNKFLTMD